MAGAGREAQDRARLASSLTQQRQARQQLSVTQELDREAAIEAEVEWRHSPPRLLSKKLPGCVIDRGVFSTRGGG